MQGGDQACCNLGRDIQGGTGHLLACMRSITPEAVLDKVREALG